MSRQRRAAARSRLRRQHETVTTEDILQLAKNSRMYSPLLNNYTLPVNASDGNGSSNMHDQYEAAVVYGKTEIIITNLRHFQEYSIEVSPKVWAKISGLKFKKVVIFKFLMHYFYTQGGLSAHYQLHITLLLF